ncbi:Trm112 family protein [Thermodesulfobacteriota bacterium B35]
MIQQELLDIIACPKCKGPVRLNEQEDGLVCMHCRLLYAIRDEIPIMLIDEATPLPAPDTEEDN